MDVASLGSDDTLSVLLGFGDGTFATAQTYNLTFGVSAFGGQMMVTGDFDGDGHPDIAVVESGRVQLFAGSSTGTLTPQTPIVVTGVASSVGLTSGDFNGDGKPDLAVWGGSSGEIAILTNQGGFMFKESDQSILSGTPSAVGTADVDGDGRVDLVAGIQGMSVLVVILNKSAGFSPQTPITVPAAVSAITLADLNGDKQPDIVAGFQNGTVQTLFNAGGGTFGAPASLGGAQSATIFQVAVGDVTRGKSPDIVATSVAELALWPSTGVGTWGPVHPFLAGMNGGLGVVDVNGDGYADVLVGDTGPDDVTVLLASAPTLLEAPTISYAPTNTAAFDTPIFADVNGDGHPDLIAVSAGSNEVGVWLNNGDGTLAPVATYGVGASATPNNVVSADFNGDGKLDLAVASPGLGSFSVLLGHGDGTFQPVRQIPASVTADVITADFNNDGKPDLLGWTGSGQFTVLLGDGTGMFPTVVTETTALPAGNQLGTLTAVKVNGDQSVDLIGTYIYCPSFCETFVFTRLGNGDGTFAGGSNVTSFGQYSTYQYLAVGDFNNDGNSDALAVSVYSGTTALALCTGDGTGTLKCGASFQDPYATNRPPSAIVAGDFNGDGKLDLALNESGIRALGILRGDGNGGFTPAFLRGVNPTANGLAAGDLRGDGRPSLGYGLPAGGGAMLNLCK